MGPRPAYNLKVRLENEDEIEIDEKSRFLSHHLNSQFADFSSNDNDGSLPLVVGDGFQLLPENDLSSVGGEQNHLLALVFCPSTLIESCCDQLNISVNNSDQISWIKEPEKLSLALLRMIHPYLSNNFKIRSIILQNRRRQRLPSDYVVLDLSHSPQAAIEDLLASTNGQTIHSGPEVILKVVLLRSVEFVSPLTSRKGSTECLGTLERKQNDRAMEGRCGIPLCAVCLHRIDPERLGLHRPHPSHRCSRLCPPPDLGGNSDVVSCPQQRLLQPWPPPSICESCNVIGKYWERSDDQQPKPLACAYCGMEETLWVCLTCAFVGCGRYSNKHAAQHNSESGHPFCLELSTLRIWSYFDGEFAHRLDLLECPSSPPLLQPWISRPQNQSASISSRGGTWDSNDSSGYVNSYTRARTAHAPVEGLVSARATNAARVDDKSPQKGTMIGEEYEALLKSALEEQELHYQGEITSLRATLTAQQLDRDTMSPDEALEVEMLRKQNDQLRADIDCSGRKLIELQTKEAYCRATSQRLLVEQKTTQEILGKIEEQIMEEKELGTRQIDELEQQIADLKANQRMMQEFSQNEDLKNSHIFGTSNQPQRTKSGKKGRRARNLFRR